MMLFITIYKWVPLLHIKLNFDMYLKSSKIQYVLYFIPVFPAVKNPLDFYKKKYLNATQSSQTVHEHVTD